MKRIKSWLIAIISLPMFLLGTLGILAIYHLFIIGMTILGGILTFLLLIGIFILSYGNNDTKDNDTKEKE